jgi:hypothetical protein
MPITPYLDGDHFEPETKRVMGVAFEATMASLRLADREDPFAAIIARKIIALAKAGESNPDRLCERVLSDVRSAKYQPFRLGSESRPG